MSEEPKKYQIRQAKLTDIPQLVGLIDELMLNEIRLGNKTISHNEDHRKAGIMIKMGIFYNKPDVRIEVATNGTGRVIGFIIGLLEPCSPIDESMTALRVWLDYMKDETLAGPKLLIKMWERMYEWGKKHGVGYAYGHILPKNIPSIRAAKHMGFRHHYTQFLYREEPAAEEKIEE